MTTAPLSKICLVAGLLCLHFIAYRLSPKFSALRVVGFDVVLSLWIYHDIGLNTQEIPGEFSDYLGATSSLRRNVC